MEKAVNKNQSIKSNLNGSIVKFAIGIIISMLVVWCISLFYLISKENQARIETIKQFGFTLSRFDKKDTTNIVKSFYDYRKNPDFFKTDEYFYAFSKESESLIIHPPLQDTIAKYSEIPQSDKLKKIIANFCYRMEGKKIESNLMDKLINLTIARNNPEGFYTHWYIWPNKKKVPTPKLSVNYYSSELGFAFGTGKFANYLYGEAFKISLVINSILIIIFLLNLVLIKRVIKLINNSVILTIETIGTGIISGKMSFRINTEKLPTEFKDIANKINDFLDLVSSKFDGISQKFEKVKTNLELVNSNMQEAKGEISDSTKELNEASFKIGEVNNGFQSVSNDISTIAAHSEEVSVTAKSGAENSKISLSNMGDVKIVLANTSSEIQEQSKESVNTAKSLKVIDAIAFQTNLLALNAAVEAARAGQHGKGFAVVADEVRNLAGRSQIAASEVDSQLENSSKTSTRVLDSFNKLGVRITDSTLSVEETVSAFDQIVIGTTEVSSHLSSITATIEETSSEMTEASFLVNNVSEKFTALTTLVIDVSDEIDMIMNEVEHTQEEISDFTGKEIQRKTEVKKSFKEPTFVNRKPVFENKRPQQTVQLTLPRPKQITEKEYGCY